MTRNVCRISQCLTAALCVDINIALFRLNKTFKIIESMISIYWNAWGRQKEPFQMKWSSVIALNTWPILSHIWEASCSLCLPHLRALTTELQHLLFTSDPRPNQDPNHCLFFGTSAPSQHWFRDETRRVHAHSPLDFAPWMPFSKDTPHQLGPLNPSAGCLGQFCNSWTTATHLLFPHSLLDPHWRHLHQILL